MSVRYNTQVNMMDYVMDDVQSRITYADLETTTLTICAAAVYSAESAVA